MLINKVFTEITKTLPIINDNPDVEDIKKFRKATGSGMMNSKAILQRFETLENALNHYKKIGGVIYKWNLN